MNKSPLVILCLLAFAAGGAAYLVLQRASAPAEVRSEFVEVKPAPAPPAPAAETAEARPQPAEAAAGAAEEAKPAATPAEPVEPAVAPTIEPGVAARPVRRAPAGRTPRVATRTRAARVGAPAPRPAPAYPGKTAGGGRGLKETTVGGAKKTGRLVGKGLKKIGGVFHD